MSCSRHTQTENEGLLESNDYRYRSSIEDVEHTLERDWPGLVEKYKLARQGKANLEEMEIVMFHTWSILTDNAEKEKEFYNKENSKF